MAWRAALILDRAYSVKNLTALARHMHVWAVGTPERTEAASAIRSEAAPWYPNSSLTLFTPASETDAEFACSEVFATLLEHQPQAALLELIGIPLTPALTSALAAADFEPCTSREYPESLPFRRPVEKLPSVPELVLDASTWKTSDDVYNSFFHAVGAPDWHGKNYHALNDSIVTGDINRIEVPYILVIRNYEKIGPDAQKTANDFIEMIEEFAARGCPVAIRMREN